MSASEKHLTLIQSARKKEFLHAVDMLETLHQEPDDVAAQLASGRTVQAQRYLRKFDAATLRVLRTFFRYMTAMERRAR
jgi:hypothetical protein